MSAPLILLLAVAFGAGWLALRPSLASMSPERRAYAAAGLLAGAAGVFFLLRLVPFGLVTLLIGGATVVNAYTRRRQATGLGEGADREAPPSRSGRMSHEEALLVLGLRPDATEEQITSAHRKMIVRAHPDQGGSDYLAAKVNEAREVLLRDGP